MVNYCPIRDNFVLYADRCILRKEAILKRIINALSLPAERTTPSSDSNYRCARCLDPRGLILG
jgi:hypothetical protein